VRFLLGVITGVALGMIFAPAPGSEVREQLAERARGWSEIPAQKAAEIAEASKEKAGEIGARVGRKAAESAVEAVTQKVLPRTERA